MSLRIFDEPAEASESPQQAEVSFPLRLLFCGWASLVAVVPVVTTTYSALGVTNLFRNMRNAESAGLDAILNDLHFFNTPLAIALGIAALLAFGIALLLAIKLRFRLASVGLPFSFGVPLLAGTPAAFLWFAEVNTLDVVQGKVIDTPIEVFAQHVSNLLFCALASSLVWPGLILVCAIVSLCISLRRRMDALSLRRPFAWAVSGMLLLAFAGAYFVLV